MNPKLLSDFAYFTSAVLFIIGLKFLSHPKRARDGNLLAAVGMAFAVVASFIYIYGGGIHEMAPNAGVLIIVGIVVGGLASISGAIYGALFIQFVPNIADEISKAAPWAIFGVFLLGFVYLMPMGIAGAVRMGLARMQRKAQNK